MDRQEDRYVMRVTTGEMVVENVCLDLMGSST